MKKKMLAGILAAALVTVSLAGCGGKDSTDTASGAKAETASQKAEETTAKAEERQRRNRKHRRRSRLRCGSWPIMRKLPGLLI